MTIRYLNKSVELYINAVGERDIIAFIIDGDSKVLPFNTNADEISASSTVFKVTSNGDAKFFVAPSASSLISEQLTVVGGRTETNGTESRDDDTSVPVSANRIYIGNKKFLPYSFVQLSDADKTVVTNSSLYEN